MPFERVIKILNLAPSSNSREKWKEKYLLFGIGDCSKECENKINKAIFHWTEDQTWPDTQYVGLVRVYIDQCDIILTRFRA